MPKRGKVRIEVELCKACGLCIEHCPSHSLVFCRGYNSKGYTPAEWNGEECSGCAVCALMCPEAAIEVWRE